MRSYGNVVFKDPRRYGTTSTRKTTWLLTGFPGRPNIGVPFQWPKRGGRVESVPILTSDPREIRATIDAAPGARAGSRAAVGRSRFR